MLPTPVPDPAQPLRDVVARIDRIESYLQDVTEEAWGADRQLRDAVERNFEVIGAALRRLGRAGPHLVDRIPEFPRSVGVQNRITHTYDDINDDLVWDVSHSRLGDLCQACQTLLQAIATDPTLGQPPPGRPLPRPPPRADPETRNVIAALWLAARANQEAIARSRTGRQPRAGDLRPPAAPPGPARPNWPVLHGGFLPRPVGWAAPCFGDGTGLGSPESGLHPSPPLANLAPGPYPRWVTACRETGPGMTVMAFDRAKIEAFLALSEGETPPVFVGRASILDDILAVAESGWGGGAAASQGKPKATRIIQGAPGAGKSTILAELARRAAGGRTQVLILNSASIHGPIDILRPLAERVDPEAARHFLARFETTHRMGGQIGALGSSVGDDRTTTTTPHAPEPTLTALRDWVQDATDKGLQGPIIIAIDEAQRLRYPDTHPVAKVLQGLHDNAGGLPLTLVLAGLGDTDAQATDMGLTRGKTLHAIGALDPDEVTELTHRWCGHFDLDPTGQAAALAALAAPCEGWPRHLHFALQALGRDILRSPDAGPAALAEVDWARVATEAAISRLHYYQSQQSIPMAKCAALVGSVLDDLRPFHRRPHVINSLTRLSRAHPGASEWHVPRGMDADALTDHLLHRGALQEGPDGALTCPIPSFRSHLVRDGIRMELGADPIGPGDVPTAGETTRILAACEPHTEDEIIHWQALAARWDRHCAAIAAIAGDAAMLASVPAAGPTDADRTRATRVLATLDAAGWTAGPDSPALPRSLPHATRAAEALAGMVDVVRTASAAIRDGEADPWRADTFADVATVPDLAVAASPEQQLAWALEHLTGTASEIPEASDPAPDDRPSPGI